MTNRHMEYFLEVYNKRSVKKAAAELFISAQGVSRTIIELENELEVTLFIRDGSYMIPTEQADFLYKHAERIVKEYALIKEKKFVGERRKLSILISYDIFQFLGYEFVKAFKELNKDIILSIINASDKDAISRISRLEADIAIITGPIGSESLAVKYLFTRNYNVVVNKLSDLSQKKYIDYSDLQIYPVALCGGYEQGAYNPNDNEVIKSGSFVNILFETLNYSLVLEAVKKNEAIGIAPDFLVDTIKDDGVLMLPFTEKNAADYYIVYNSEKTLSPDAKKFYEFLIRWCKDHCDKRNG